jgi:hypothetical protein
MFLNIQRLAFFGYAIYSVQTKYEGLVFTSIPARQLNRVMS